MTIVSIDPLYAELVLPAATYSRYEKGASIDIRPDGYPVVTGEVTVVDPVIDAASRTYGVRVRLGAAPGLPAGVSCVLVADTVSGG
jgi:hypothetical protein